MAVYLLALAKASSALSTSTINSYRKPITRVLTFRQLVVVGLQGSCLLCHVGFSPVNSCLFRFKRSFTQVKRRLRSRPRIPGFASLVVNNINYVQQI